MIKFIDVPTPVLKIWIGREEAKLEKDSTNNNRRIAACRNISIIKAEILARGEKW